ncbi:MAG: hypothetical protein GY850_37040 [bacterium]|nr:hypothetical protein [bacterium]
MELLVNDLSLEGQFNNIASFKDAIRRVMTIRKIAQQNGRELHCHRCIAQAHVTSTMIMPEAVNKLAVDERRALLQWLTKQGPFWEDARNHSPDEWLEWNDSIVTDTAVGEAAWCCLNGIDRKLVSFTPSSWEFTPVFVCWVTDTESREKVGVVNFWDSTTIEAALKNAPAPIISWEQLETLSSTRCPQLDFANDAFEPLRGYPFVSGAAQRILFVIETLNHFKSCFDAGGQRTAEGHEIYRKFFTGKKGNGSRGPIFSDSSNREKRDFKDNLTFKHPNDATKNLFCTWHGKVQTPQLRVHFSWPIRKDEPLYIVYIGPKITKK